MGQVSMTVRMDENLKSAFDALCGQFGMSANTAMNVFARAVVQRGKIPFEIRGDKAEVIPAGLAAFNEMRSLARSGQLPDLTLEEINEEISKARNERR